MGDDTSIHCGNSPLTCLIFLPLLREVFPSLSYLFKLCLWTEKSNHHLMMMNSSTIDEVREIMALQRLLQSFGKAFHSQSRNIFRKMFCSVVYALKILRELHDCTHPHLHQSALVPGGYLKGRLFLSPLPAHPPPPACAPEGHKRGPLLLLIDA